MEETSWFMTIIANPFAKGLAIGIAVCIIVYLRGLLRSRITSYNVCYTKLLRAC